MGARYPRPAPAGFELPAFTPEPWTKDAACTQVDPDVFFPDPSDTEGRRRAQGICVTCPVLAECFEYATRPPRQEHGIWAGRSFHRPRKRGE